MTWIPVKSSGSEAVAIANICYDPKRDPCLDRNLLRIKVGQKLKLLKEKGEWYYGYAQSDSKTRALIPRNHIHITRVKDEKSLIHEVYTVLVEWNALWKQLYIENRSEDSDYITIKRQMYSLINDCKSLFYSKQTQEQLKDLEIKVKKNIDSGNARLKLDLIVRDEEGITFDVDVTSAVTLLRQHEFADKNSRMVRISIENQKVNTSFNLKVEMRAANCKVGDNYDILMYLYDVRTERSISETFIMKYNSQLSSQSMDKIMNTTGLFTDLGLEDSKREKIALVFFIVRVGRMESKSLDVRKGMKDMKRDPVKDIRRPFGVAALDITDIMADGSPIEKLVPYQGCVEKDSLIMSIQKAMVGRESGRDKRSESLKDSSKTMQGIHINVQKVVGDVFQNKDQLIVTQNGVSARKIGFPDVILPSYYRNEVHITLNFGIFNKPAGKSDGNIEVTMTVCNELGHKISGVISEGANGDMVDEYKSIVYYHESKPKWYETVKVEMSVELFHSAHLKFTLRHRASAEAKDRSSKPYAFAYIKLMQENGTTLKDTSHELIVYKLVQGLSSVYLRHPCTTSDKTPKMMNSLISIIPLNNDTLNISTTVVSTKLTHNVNLMGVLKSRECINELSYNLINFMSIGGHEIMKFLHDILDALFNILVNDNFDMLVFNALVFIVSLVSTEKYCQFRDVLNVYIDEDFCSTLAYNNLLSVFTSYLAEALYRPTPVEVTPKTVEGVPKPIGGAPKPIEVAPKPVEIDLTSLENALTSLEYLFKFIVKSRLRYTSVIVGQDSGKETFHNSICSVYESITALMLCPDPSHHRVKVNAMKYMPTTIANIINVIEPQNISQIFVDFLEAIPKNTFIPEKLNCMRDLIESVIFQNAECRHILLPTIVKYLATTLEKGDIRGSKDSCEDDKCIDILADIMNLLFSCQQSEKDEDIQIIMKLILRTIVQTVIRKDRKMTGTCTAVMLSILRQITEAQYLVYAHSFDNYYDLLDILTEMLMVFMDLIGRPVFPGDWSEMILMQNSVFLRSLRFFSQSIKETFTSIFHEQLWKNYFECMISFLTQDCLQLEQFTEAKRTRIISKYNDMRREAAFEVVTMWFYLNSNKMKFIPETIGKFLEMTLIPESRLRKETIKIFYDIMQCEFMSNPFGGRSDQIKGNFQKFEKEIILKIDAMVGSGKGDEEYRSDFSKILNEYFTTTLNIPDVLRSQGHQCVETIDTQLNLLLEYREAMSRDSLDNRLNAIVNLMKFYSEIERRELYIRYLNKLCALHLAGDNYVEAAYTLLRNARLLNWSNESLGYMASEKYTTLKTHRQLKEKLYVDIIYYFDKADMWFKAIEISKDLQYQYEFETFEYEKVADVLKKIAKLYSRIMDPTEKHPNYFRVGFFGLGFPKFLRNKYFIYRGACFETMGSFKEGMKIQFPKSTFLTSLFEPSQEIKDSNSQNLLVNNVEPLTQLPDHLRNKNINKEMIDYYKYNETSTFSYKKNKDGCNDLMKMVIYEYYLTTVEQLPGVLRWSEVMDSTMRVMEPIDNAIDVIAKKNALLKLRLAQTKSDVQPLNLILVGVVSPVVNGGLAQYKSFYTDDYLNSHNSKENLDRINELRSITAVQLALIQIGLTLYSERIANNPKLENLKAGHDNNMDQFKKLKVTLANELGIQLTAEIQQQVQATTQIGANDGMGRKRSLQERNKSYIEQPMSGHTSRSTSQIPPEARNIHRSFTRILPNDDLLTLQDELISQRNSVSSYDETPPDYITNTMKPARPQTTLTRPVVAQKPTVRPTVSAMNPMQSSFSIECDSQVTPKSDPPPLPKKEPKQRMTLLDSRDSVC